MRIETVTGTIEAGDLGATLMHEHVSSLAPQGFYSGGGESDLELLAPQALGPLTDVGVATLVDLTGASRTANLETEFGRLHSLAMGLPFHMVAGFS